MTNTEKDISPETVVTTEVEIAESIKKSTSARSTTGKLAKKVLREDTPGTPEYEKKEESQKVEIIFRFHELAGGTLSFGYKKYKGPIEEYNLVDGERYTLPLGVIRHVNSLGTPIYVTKTLPNKKVIQEISRIKHRCSCESASFSGLGEFNKFKEMRQTPSVL